MRNGERREIVERKGKDNMCGVELRKRVVVKEETTRNHQ
jgi:hypothetical protein